MFFFEEWRGRDTVEALAYQVEEINVNVIPDFLSMHVEGDDGIINHNYGGIINLGDF